MNQQLIITADGSHSIRLTDQRLTYHSLYGAIQEAEQVYIQPGFSHPTIAAAHDIRVFETGFGTGLNALLALTEAEKSGKIIRYEAIEPFPLTCELASALNYCEKLARPDLRSSFLLMHQCPFNRETPIGNRLIFTKRQVTLEEYHPSGQFHLIFFDAFAPADQPELWTFPVFSKLASMCYVDGVLLTFSVKGAVRRNLHAAGFHVEKLPGPPGKKEITRAVRSSQRVMA